MKLLLIQTGNLNHPREGWKDAFKKMARANRSFSEGYSPVFVSRHSSLFGGQPTLSLPIVKKFNL